MPDVADEELAKGLRDARTKPRHFVAIIKGTSVLKLVVRKKVVKAAEIQSLRTELKGTAALSGVVQLIGGEHVFQSIEEPPEIKLQPLKDYISEQTDLTVKPRFEVVKALTEVKDTDDGQASTQSQQQEQEQQSQQQTSESSADELQSLVAAMKQMQPDLQAAMVAHPARQKDLLDAVALFRAQIKAEDAAKAKPALLAATELLKSLAGESKPTSQPTLERGANQQQEQWQAAFAAAEPRYLAALKQAPDALAGKLRVIFTYATEQAEAGAFDKALAAVGRLLPMLSEVEQGPGQQPTSSRLVETRTFLLTRFRQIRAELNAELDTLKAAIIEAEADEDPVELVSEMRKWLESLLEQMQDAINASISAGDDYKQSQRVIRGLVADVDEDELIKHLLTLPLGPAGEQFTDAIIAGLDEVADELATSSAA